MWWGHLEFKEEFIPLLEFEWGSRCRSSDISGQNLCKDVGASKFVHSILELW